MSEISIRVIGRFRPINSREKEEAAAKGWDPDNVSPFDIREGKAVEVLPSPEENRPKPYIYPLDAVLWQCTQTEAFNTIALPTVLDTLRGFNGTIFAYGQTGSGKTFSMFGPELPPAEAADPSSLPLMGLIPRSCFFLFKALQDTEQVLKFEIKLACLEVYVGNQLRDLLHPQTKGLRVRDGVKGVFIQGLQANPVNSVVDVLQCIEIAISHRTVSATKMNATSSRSHSIFMFEVAILLSEGGKKVAKLNFADLAGSEKVGKTGVTGKRLQEGAAINASLTVLGRVISSLAKGTQAPFRESGLTHVLKDSLMGNTKTTLLVCLSPHKFNVMETMNTLQFAQRAKLIKNKIKVNKVLTKKDLQREIKRLNKENSDLKKKLRQKVTTATHVDAPEQGLPYFKMTFQNEAEPSTDAQYILRRKEVQKEIRKLISEAHLEGVTVETEIRRKAPKEQKSSTQGQHVSTLPTITEDSQIEEHDPLVVHLLFQPSEKYSGDELIKAKDKFIAQIQKSGTLFKNGDIEEGFANPEDYGSSLSVAMQRQMIDDLNALQLEKDHLDVKLKETENELKLLRDQVADYNLKSLEEDAHTLELERELYDIQQQNMALQTSNLARDLSLANSKYAVSPNPSPTGGKQPIEKETTEVEQTAVRRKRARSVKIKPEPQIVDEPTQRLSQIEMNHPSTSKRFPIPSNQEDAPSPNPTLPDVAETPDKPKNKELDEIQEEDLEARILSQQESRTRPKPPPIKPRARTSFVSVQGQLSALLTPTNTKPISSNYEFPQRKQTAKSQLRRTLSIREAFRDLSTEETYNIQAQSLADMKAVFEKLQTENHGEALPLLEIRNLFKHTMNRMRVVCDELEQENLDHEEYVDLLKEQLDTRHKELDAAYEDIEVLKGALEKRHMLLSDANGESVTINLDDDVDGALPEAAQSPREQAINDFLRSPSRHRRRWSQPTSILGIGGTDRAKSLPRQDNPKSPQSHRQRAQSMLRAPRQSFMEVVGLVSAKLDHLKSDMATDSVFDLANALKSPIHDRMETLTGAWFEDEKDVIDWTCEEVVNWLAEIEDGTLERFADQFEERGVTGEAILAFTRRDLRDDFNMDRGHIKIFFKHLAHKDEIVKTRLLNNRKSRHKRRAKKKADYLAGKYSVQTSIIQSNAYEKHLQRLYEKEFGSNGNKRLVSSLTLYPGDLVRLDAQRKGRVFYKGEIPGKSGQFIGVELINGKGLHDGAIGQHRLFRSLPKKALFVKSVQEVLKVTELVKEEESASSPDMKRNEWGGDMTLRSMPSVGTVDFDMDMPGPYSPKPPTDGPPIGGAHHGHSLSKGSLVELRDMQRMFGMDSLEEEDSLDFSLSESSDDETSETVTFTGHKRHFSAIPTVNGSGSGLPATPPKVKPTISNAEEKDESDSENFI